MKLFNITYILAFISVLGLNAQQMPAAKQSEAVSILGATAHIGNGLFMANNGYEYALTLLAVTVALTIQGAGYLSVDGLLLKNKVATTID